MPRLLVALLAGVLWPFQGMVAQDQAPPPVDPTLSGAFGIVVDSIHGGPLPRATVRIAGTSHTGITDSNGYYRIDSVPPGRYRLELQHPLLDTLGMAVGTQPIEFPAGRMPVVPLGVPSGPAMLDIACPQITNPEGPAGVLGVVRDPDTGVPAIGAVVSLTWIEVRVSREVGARSLRRTRSATVDSAGNYAICGLPADLGGTVWAAHDSGSTAGVEIRIDERSLVALRSLGLGASELVVDTVDGVVRRLTRGPAMLRGRVLAADGSPIAGARVEVPGTRQVVFSAPAGTFALESLPAGTQAVLVRGIGYSPQREIVELSGRAPGDVTVNLSAVQILPTLESEVAASGLDRVGFTDRQRTGLGRFITREQIEQRNPMVFTDVFITTPGIRLGRDASGNEVLESTRAGNDSSCTAVFVDRFQLHPPTPDQLVQHLNLMVRPENVWAVEVYQPNQVPGEFMVAGQRCLTIVVWTRTAVGQTQNPPSSP